MHQSKLISTLFLFASMAIPLSVCSQEAPREHYNKWEFSGSLSQVSFDPLVETDRDILIEDSAVSLGFTADYDLSRWLITLGMDLVLYDDKAGFTQRTVNTFGSESDSDSSADGLLLSAAFGPKWHFAKEQSVFVSTQVGMAYMVESSRSIGNCTDCSSEDIEIEGGLFAKAQLMKNVTSSVAWGLHFTQYVGSDEIDSSIGIIISTAY